MGQIPRLLQAAFEPLLLEPRTGALLASVLRRKLAGVEFTGFELHAELGIAMPGSPIVAADRPPTTVQTLIFPKTHWKSAEDCKKWARDHDFRDDKVDETEDSWRLRQRDPGEFVDGSFRTICLEGSEDPGAADCRVKGVVGHLQQRSGAASPRAAALRTRAASPDGARVAILPIQGLITQHPQSLGTSTDEIAAMLDAALARSQVDAIVLDVDSPGGTVQGVPELADKILAARGVKPIVAIANSLAASAGYWLASAADKVLVPPSGELGSIGVYTMHEDWSKALEQDGVAVTAISAGKFKLDGAPWAPLGEEARAVLQKRVDEVYGWFVKAVATHRRDSQANVRAGYGEGRILGAEQAVAAGLADQIGTFDEAVALAATKAIRKTGPRAELLQQRLVLDRARVLS